MKHFFFSYCDRKDKHIIKISTPAMGKKGNFKFIITHHFFIFFSIFWTFFQHLIFSSPLSVSFSAFWPTILSKYNTTILYLYCHRFLNIFINKEYHIIFIIMCLLYFLVLFHEHSKIIEHQKGFLYRQLCFRMLTQFENFPIMFQTFPILFQNFPMMFQQICFRTSQLYFKISLCFRTTLPRNATRATLSRTVMRADRARGPVLTRPSTETNGH